MRFGVFAAHPKLSHDPLSTISPRIVYRQPSGHGSDPLKRFVSLGNADRMVTSKNLKTPCPMAQLALQTGSVVRLGLADGREGNSLR
jgi:hypothetical protein